jgi:type II secretory pathway component PulJ
MTSFQATQADCTDMGCAARRVRVGFITNRQSGMSLVELMVGITIGLFIVAAASLMVGNQLSDNRRLLLETQLQQDLRATMDIMTRQLRRAGAVDNDSSVGLIADDKGLPGGQNLALINITPGASRIRFKYYQNAGEQGDFGFKLEDETIRTQLTSDNTKTENWQDLTDRNSVKVTRLEFNRLLSPAGLPTESERIPCPKLCPVTGDTSCWPRIEIRSYKVVLEAQARSDAKVSRSLTSLVRVRNDLLQVNTGPGGPVCPA